MDNTNNITDKTQQLKFLKKEVGLTIPGIILLIFGIIISSPLISFTFGQWKLYNYIDIDNIIGIIILSLFSITGLFCLIFEVVKILKKNKTSKTDKI